MTPFSRESSLALLHKLKHRISKRSLVYAGMRLKQNRVRSASNDSVDTVVYSD